MVINIAEQFSLYPAGRTHLDGPDNGKRFREELLAPALRAAAAAAGEKVTVVLDGVRSFGSSFLEEAFGGLIRKEEFLRPQLASILEIEAKAKEYGTYKRLIERYILEAKAE